MSRSNRLPRRRRADAGFTLIEVLVALAIAAVALVAIDRLVSTASEGGVVADRYNRALLIAQSALEALNSRAPVANYAEQRDLPGGYRRAVAVRPRPDLLPNAGSALVAYPYEVSIDVSWPAAHGTRSVSLSEIRTGLPP